jgi:predicted acylesterase/phospholipase RssA
MEDSDHSKRIGLALSGGGFRATLYHLGVIRFLRDAGLLQSISHITSVSGGSILAAHLVQNWDRYTGTPDQFDAMANELVAFAQMDIRNRIVRRFPIALPIQALRWAARLGSNHRLTRTGLLQAYYERHLYGDTCLFQLPESPALYILSTNLTEGALCAFSRDGIIVQKRLPGDLYRFDQLHAGLATLGLAVTASSAFPGFFPPLEVSWHQVGGIEGQFDRQVFTDGGVFDNLGVRMFRNLERTWIGREAELSRRDFYDVRCVVQALSASKDLQKSSPVVRLAQLYNEHNGNGNGDDGNSVVAALRQVVNRSQLYREPSFEEVQPEDPEAVALLRSVRNSGKELEFHDRSWLNRQMLETVLRHATGKRCLRPLNAMFDAVLVSDAGKHLRAMTQVQPMGMITTAMRASDIGMDRVWQLEKETFGNQAGFVFLSIEHIVDEREDPTALHPEVQRCLQGIRTDMDAFSSLEISALVRHGYSVARSICRSRPELGVNDPPMTPPWDPLDSSDSFRRSKSRPVIRTIRPQQTASPEVAAARTLQRSALRQVWNRLFNWRDWTSYVYLALAVGLLMIGPAILYHFLDQRQATAKIRRVVDAIAQTDHDQQVVMRLAEQGPVAPWIGPPIEEVSKPSAPTVKGVNYVTDRQIFDLRQQRPSNAASKNAETGGSIYVRRRIRLEINEDFAPHDRLVLPFTVFAKDCEVRCANTALDPRLKRLRSNGGFSAAKWEISLDLATVAVGEPVDVILEIIYPKGISETFWSNPHLVVRVDMPVRELVLWLLLPEDRPYDSYHLVEIDPERVEASRFVVPSEGVQKSHGTIMHWTVFSPKPDADYECRWNGALGN